MLTYLFRFLNTFLEATLLNDVEEFLRRLHLEALHRHSVHAFHCVFFLYTFVRVFVRFLLAYVLSLQLFQLNIERVNIRGIFFVQRE